MPASATWIKKREKEPAKSGALEALNISDPLPSKAIRRYTEKTMKKIGHTKAQVPRTIATYPIAYLPCHWNGTEWPLSANRRSKSCATSSTVIAANCDSSRASASASVASSRASTACSTRQDE